MEDKITGRTYKTLFVFGKTTSKMLSRYPSSIIGSNFEKLWREHLLVFMSIAGATSSHMPLILIITWCFPIFSLKSNFDLITWKSNMYMQIARFDHFDLITWNTNLKICCWREMQMEICIYRFGEWAKEREKIVHMGWLRN